MVLVDAPSDPRRADVVAQVTAELQNGAPSGLPGGAKMGSRRGLDVFRQPLYAFSASAYLWSV